MLSSDPRRTRIVFVTGASRSGTTMVSRILGNHSQILGLRELHYFGDLCEPATVGRLDMRALTFLAARIFSRHARDVWGSDPTELELSKARELCESLAPEQRTGYGVFAASLACLATDAGKSIVCEQTPRNVFYAQNILANLPGAAFVHVVRDPRAVLASQKNRWKLRQLGARRVPLHETIRTWVNYHPVTMAKLWRNATDAAIRLRGHHRVMLTRFEDLVADPEVHIRTICDFLEVSFEPVMSLIPKWGSSNVKHETDKKGLSKDVLDQWESVLSDGEVEIVEHITGELMSRFSYVPRSQGSGNTRAMLPHRLTYPLHLVGVALTNPRRALIQARAMLQSSKRRS
jgi:hypothetical protein